MEQRPHIARAKMKPRVRRQEKPDDLMLRDDHAFGHARGARGVNDVRRRVRPGERRGIFRAERGERGRVAVEAKRGCVRAGNFRQQPLLREHHGRLRVGEDEAEPLTRRVGIERHVRAAGLEHGEDGGEQIGGAFEADGDEHLRPDAQRAEMMGEPVGARVQLAIRDVLLFKSDRDGFGRSRRMRLEKLMDAAFRDEAACRGADQCSLFPGAQQRQSRDAFRRCRHRRGEERAVMTEPARNGRRVEKIGVEIAIHAQLRAGINHVHAEVEKVERLGRRDDFRLQIRQRKTALRAVDVEGRRDQRRAAGIAHELQLLDEAAERESLVLRGFEQIPFHRREQRRKRLVAPEFGPHRQQVDAVPDERAASGERRRVELPRRGHADDEVALPAQPVQPDFESREQIRQQRAALARRRLPQRAGKLCGEDEPRAAGAIRFFRRTHAGRRQLDGLRRAGKFRDPILLRRCSRRRVLWPREPGRVVGVLQRRTERVVFTAALRRIDFLQLVENHAHRPAIHREVMRREQKRMVLRRRADELRTKDRPVREVESARVF